jgi:opacity protein-like surface antigen
MKKLGLVVILLVGFSVMAVAADVPAVEVFGGYSFYRCSTVSTAASCNLNGWNAGATFNVSENWSGVFDVSGHYGYIDDYSPSFTWFDLKSHTFLFGPRYTVRAGKVSPFMQALVGIKHLNPERDLRTTGVTNSFTMAFGGGVDYAINDRISLRPAQLDYVTVRQEHDFTNNLRYSAGIVFKFGKR